MEKYEGLLLTLVKLMERPSNFEASTDVTYFRTFFCTKFCKQKQMKFAEYFEKQEVKVEKSISSTL